MLEQKTHIYEFGPFHLNPAERLLLRDGEIVPLAPKVFDLLLVLVEHQGHLMEKDELMKLVWADSFVEEANLSVKMSALRKALGESPGETQYIETVPKRGYRFVTTVKEVNDGSSSIFQAGEKINSENETDARLASEQNATPASSKGAEEPTPPDSQNSLVEKKRRKLGMALALTALSVALGFIVYGLYFYMKRNPSASFQAMKLSPLTTIGKVVQAVISPDGKYVVYAEGEAGQQGLWVRQLATGSNVQIIPPADIGYFGLTFSQDSNYVYYVLNEKNYPMRYLYRMPVLGGVAKKVVTDVDSSITFSPDGKQIAFQRFSPPEKLSALVIANVDGTGEQRLATRNGADQFAEEGAAWSPDGKFIASAVVDHDAAGRYMSVVGVRLEDGSTKPLTSKRWSYIGRIAWLQDGSGFLTTASEQDSSPAQIWLISYPSGEARRITNDLNDYRSVSLTTDSASLVAIHKVHLSSLWMIPNGNAALAKQITFGKLDGDAGLAWTPDGRIVFTSNKSDNQDIWIMDADGSHQKQLTIDAGANNSPAVSPDGRYIVFCSNRAGAPNIWRMDVDGSNLKRLTSGSRDDWPVCSPDGSWVFYQGGSFGKPMVAKVPIDGGEPVPASEIFIGHHPTISPDGKLIAGFYVDEEHPYLAKKIALLSAEGGELRKVIDRPSTNEVPGYLWTTDGRAIMYIDTQKGISNIWSQPIDGGPPRKVTDFNSEQIFYFGWSRDGKQLLCARGVETSDAIRIENFR